MNATWNDIAIPVQVKGVFLGKRGDVHRCLERQRNALFAGEGIFVGRITSMKSQCRFERAFETGGRFVLRVLLMPP